MKNVKKRFIDITAMTFIAIVFLLIISWQSIYAEEKIQVTIAGGHIPTISGSIGVPIESQTITLNFGDGVRLSQTLTAKTDITNWFSCETTDFPHGIYVVVKETALVGSSSITVEFYGTTEGASRDTITMQVKRSMLNGVSTSGTQWIDVEFTSATKPSFNIVRNSRVPDGFCGTGLFIWFKTSDGKSTIAETKGWKLNGEKGKAITSNNELEVFIYGNFTREYAAGTDISSWFTGNLIYTDTSTYEVTHSFLPGGVTAKLKNKISRGDSRFTIVFTGTPTQGSRDLIAITIPAGVTTHPTTDGRLGDVSTPIQVNNITGKFSYSITSDDYYDSYTECVKITYPEAEIKAGQVITESDDLIATYELVGKDANGNPLKYDNVKVGDKLRFVTVAGKVYYDGGLYEDIGLEGTVKSFSSDRTKMYVLLTGKVKTQRVYPYTIRTYRFTLNWPSVTADGRFVNGYDAGESKFKVVAPNPTITIEYDPDYYEGPISATYKIGDKKVTYGTRVFWINFGDDALNLDYLTSAHLLPILYVQGAKGGGGNWNGIRFLPVEGYQKGSK